jgi:hypothetical protein
MEHNEKQYIAGFNNGYILANYEPLTLSSVVKGLQSDNSYIKGLLQGQLEFEKVQSRYRRIGIWNNQQTNDERTTFYNNSFVSIWLYVLISQALIKKGAMMGIRYYSDFKNPTLSPYNHEMKKLVP